MKTVLVTGASGFLGHHIVQELLKRNDTKVIAILGRPEDKANPLPESSNLIIYPCSSLFSTNWGHVDTLIHTAFSRGDNLSGLTRSIELTEQILELVNGQNIDSIINISSQGVYKGLKPGEKATETSFVEPNTSYGLAKWAVENMLSIGCKKSYTSVRLASLSANARFLDFFVDCVIKGSDILVSAPRQYASIMDVKDAVSGLLSLESIEKESRDHLYNLGPGLQYSILELANIVNSVGQTLGFHEVSINIDDNGKDFAICMDCTKLIKLTGWRPETSINTIILNMFLNKMRVSHDRM